MPRIYKWIVPFSILLLIPAGCQETQRSTAATHTPPYMVSINQLASKLGLSITLYNGRYYELTNRFNRVLLFTHPGGNIYVNGQEAGSVGSVIQSGDKMYFPELVIPKIRGWLKTSEPKPAPIATPSNQYALSGRTVIIDPGHGGKDPGAISYLGYYEKKVNLAISHKIVSRLKSRGINIIMTRDRDVYPELDERVSMANRIRPDLFVSIHADANHDRMLQGFTIYVSRKASDASRRAGRILEQHLSRTGINSKGMRTQDYRVLAKTTCPAVLVECGYLSNPSEAALLLDTAYQNRIAEAIAEAVIQYLNS